MLAIYTRLSKEDKDSASIQNQIREGKEFASKLNVGYKLYNEGEGVSGGAEIKDRPQLFGLLQDIRSNDIDKVWFRSQNRLERNSSTYAIFISEAQKYKVDVYFNDKLLDFDNPSDNLLGTITSAVNQYQKDLQASQTKRTLKDNVKEGKVWSVVAYGYKSENGFLAIDEDESLIVKRVFNESLKGVGTRKIAEIFNNEGILTRYNKIGKGTIQKTNKQTKKVTKSITKDIDWAGNTIRNIITNTLYKGERKFSGDVYESPIIINPILWQEVNDNLKKNRNNSGKKVDHKYLLKGKLICSKCGRNYYGKRRADLSDNFYMCSSKRIKNQNCGNRSINIEILDRLVWHTVLREGTLKEHIIDQHSKTLNTTSNNKLITKRDWLKDQLNITNKKITNSIELTIGVDDLDDDIRAIFKTKIDSLQKTKISLKDDLEIIKKELIVFDEMTKDIDSKLKGFTKIESYNKLTHEVKSETINNVIKFISIQDLKETKHFCISIVPELGYDVKPLMLLVNYNKDYAYNISVEGGHIFGISKNGIEKAKKLNIIKLLTDSKLISHKASDNYEGVKPVFNY